MTKNATVALAIDTKESCAVFLAASVASQEQEIALRRATELTQEFANQAGPG